MRISTVTEGLSFLAFGQLGMKELKKKETTIGFRIPGLGFGLLEGKEKKMETTIMSYMGLL